MSSLRLADIRSERSARRTTIDPIIPLPQTTAIKGSAFRSGAPRGTSRVITMTGAAGRNDRKSAIHWRRRSASPSTSLVDARDALVFPAVAELFAGGAIFSRAATRQPVLSAPRGFSSPIVDRRYHG